MTIWIHKKTGQIALSFPVFARVRENLVDAFTIESFQYVGDALENEHGYIFIFSPSWRKHFEFVGEL